MKSMPQPKRRIKIWKQNTILTINSSLSVSHTFDLAQEILPLQTKREIGLIPALDHDAMEYEEFDKDFYEPCADIKNQTAQQVM